MGIKKLFKLKTAPFIKQLEHVQLEKQYGGVIHQLQLDDFWHHLKGTEKSFIRNCTKWSFGGSVQPEEIDHPKSNATTKRSDCGFLLGNATWAYEAREYELAEKLLNEIVNRSNSLLVTHRAYQELIKMHNLLRLTEESSKQKCKEYCMRDIELAPLLFNEAMNKGSQLPQILAFKVLKEVLTEDDQLEECEELRILEQQYNVGRFAI